MHERNRHRAFVDVFCRCFALNKCSLYMGGAGQVVGCPDDRWMLPQQGEGAFSRFSADLGEK